MTQNSANDLSNTNACWACQSLIPASAKFCGNCGATKAGENNQTISNSSVAADSAQNKFAVPDFAHISLSQTNNKPNTGLQDEAYKVILLLARERLFLYVHWIIFLCCELIGIFLVCKCYREFNADDLSRIVMALIPFLFINLVSLMWLVPIHGTRNQIYRLKEQLHSLKLQIEYTHLR